MSKIVRTMLVVLTIWTALAFALPVESYAAVGAETRRVLVEFAPGQKVHVLQFLAREDAQLHYEFDRLNVVAVTLPARTVDKLGRNPNVVRIEEDHPRYPADQVVPYGIDSVEARDVWDTDRDSIIDPGAPTGDGRTVCIIDSGLDVNHEDFAGVNIIGGYPSGWDTDNYGHGTHVAGTVAAMHNTTGVIGVTPGAVSLYIVKVFGDNGEWTYTSSVIDAASRCQAAGAHIVSMSFTGPFYSSYEDSMFQSLYDEGMLLVAAAGNGGGTDYGYPAAYDAVISVGAVDQNNVVASFSRRNDQVELTAPGVSVYSTYKDNGYAYMSGTSMAAPHVAASAALAWSSDLNKTNLEVRAALQGTALDQGATGRDNEYGYGVIKTACAIQALNPAPTSVELVRFEAAAGDPTAMSLSINLAWETATEIDNLGFHLYRQIGDGELERLNAALIPSQVAPGSPVGAVYRFEDTGVEQGAVYSYWLETVDVQGRTQRHGPVRVRTSAPKAAPRG